MNLPTMPRYIAKLPRFRIMGMDAPVPWFVQWFKTSEDGTREPCITGEGEPDFRVANQNKFFRALHHGNCWICGEPVGVFKAFVIGPMCAISRTISEPPSHKDCAIFSAMACPFLTRPKMKRNEKDIPFEAGLVEAGGMAIRRNPGAVCVWICRDFTPFRPHSGNDGVLFRLGKPDKTLWFAEGRPATRDEVMASIDSGYPILLEQAQMERGAVEALATARKAAMAYLPA